MGKAQTRATNKYINKVYDRINLMVPKGRKADIDAHAKSKGESVNGLINSLLRTDMGIPEDEWKNTEG